jgi:hypothetical protein
MQEIRVTYLGQDLAQSFRVLRILIGAFVMGAIIATALTMPPLASFILPKEAPAEGEEFIGLILIAVAVMQMTAGTLIPVILSAPRGWDIGSQGARTASGPGAAKPESSADYAQRMRNVILVAAALTEAGALVMIPAVVMGSPLPPARIVAALSILLTAAHMLRIGPIEANAKAIQAAEKAGTAQEMTR